MYVSEHPLAVHRVSKVDRRVLRLAFFAEGANAEVAVRSGAVQAENWGSVLRVDKYVLHDAEMPVGMAELAAALTV